MALCWCVRVCSKPCLAVPSHSALLPSVCVQDVAEDLESVKLESIPAIRNIIHSNFADVFSCESRLLSALVVCSWHVCVECVGTEGLH